MIKEFDVRAVIKSTTKEIFDIKLLPMIVCTDSKLLYNYLVKLGSTQENRLMVDIICLRQLYKRREIMEIRWINRNSNLANAMTKAKPCAALQELIDTNTISLNTAG